MNASARPVAKFLAGSTLSHVLTMTLTGSIGLVSVFAVDAISLFYVAQLGKPELTAALGFGSTLLFFAGSVSIGLSIASAALTARLLGRGDTAAAKRTAGAALMVVALVMSLLSIVLFPLLAPLLALMGAKGAAAQASLDFMRLVLPSVPLLGLGMCLSALLRAIGDARRSMLVMLLPALSLLVLDPLMIFGLGLELRGAAVATIIARVFIVALGLYGLLKVHRLFTWPTAANVRELLKPFFAIGGPAILTQIATPFANSFVTATMARFGDEAVAGSAIIARLTPVAFGVLFAMSGAVGPIIGQNLGGQRIDRVRSTFIDSIRVALIYCLVVSLALAVFAEPIARAFDARGEAFVVVVFFCRFVAVTFVFSGMLFVVNAAFNNLGYAGYSTLLNWGRATLGVIPFVWLGGLWFGPRGVIAGSALGATVFGLLATWMCLRVVRRLADANPAGGGPIAVTVLQADPQADLQPPANP